MTRVFRALVAAAFAGGLALPAGAGMEGHAVVASEEVEWTAGPASLAPGAEMAVLYGNPAEEGLFAMRLKLPAGYAIAPHTHPKPEIVTVISGTLLLGMGESADRAATQALPAGSFFAFEPGMAHYVFTDVETVVQLNSTGPWNITYVDPADDPRQASQ